MAYRRSHQRRGYYRRTPNGDYCWVRPTTVSGYEYTPGTAQQFMSVPSEYKHISASLAQFKHFRFHPQSTYFFRHRQYIDEIIRLFRLLDSSEQTYCLEKLQSIHFFSSCDLTTSGQINEQSSSPVYESEQPSSTPCAGIRSYKHRLHNESSFQDNKEDKAAFSSFVLSQNADGSNVIVGYHGKCDKNLTIPNCIDNKLITAIGQYAFHDHCEIENLTISEGITDIQSSAFVQCSNLISVSLPSTLICIGSYAFNSCYALHSIIVPENVEVVGSFAFSMCKRLEEVTLPKKLNRISSGMFFCCYNLHKINFPALCETVEDNAFMKTQLFLNTRDKLMIPLNVKYIGSNAFGLATHGATIYVPNSVGKISFDAFPHRKKAICIVAESENAYARTFAQSNGFAFENAQFFTDAVAVEHYISSLRLSIKLAEESLKANKILLSHRQSIEKAIANLKATEPTYKTYSRIPFQKFKDHYAFTHNSEIEIYKQSCAVLESFHLPIPIRSEEFASHLQMLELKNSHLHSQINAAKSELRQVRHSHYYVK